MNLGNMTMNFTTPEIMQQFSLNSTQFTMPEGMVESATALLG
jgi:hypothetical protein